jgi:plastocyanin
MRLARWFALALVVAGAVGSLSAQSLIQRPPNLGGTWIPPGGVLQFNFLHRFVVSSAASKKISNFPTFAFILGLGHNLSFGTRYASNSFTVAQPTVKSNEFELLARLRFGAAEHEKGLALAITPAYNAAARSLDGEVSADYSRGRFTVSLAGRGIQKPFGSSSARFAAAGGVSLRLNDYVALSGDVAKLFGLDSAAAWSAGLSFVIPGSPHTFSLHASNSKSTTIQGASYGPNFSQGRVAYGFEFTIPIRFSRFAPWFGRGSRAVPANGAMMNVGAALEIHGQAYKPDSVEVGRGASVRWVNRDFVDHTVTFEQPGPVSSNFIRTNGTFTARFDEPGVYRYHCTPHPDMKGVVVVK